LAKLGKLPAGKLPDRTFWRLLDVVVNPSAEKLRAEPTATLVRWIGQTVGAVDRKSLKTNEREARREIRLAAACFAKFRRP
jgi:hypothetical protein